MARRRRAFGFRIRASRRIADAGDVTTDLVITNGDAAGELLRRTLLGSEVLPWRDVLHEGPVPLTATLEDLTAGRIEYLAGAGGGEIGAIEFELTSRDRGLAVSGEFDRVVLWFEHDLYDQLQLLQVLDWFADHPRKAGTLLLVQVDDYIGRLEPDALSDFAATARPVSQAHLDLARRAWAALRQPTPEAWAELLAKNTAALPFLRPAILRMLEELPGPDGLTRTERQMLAVIEADESITALGLFVAVQKMEDAEFMGDWSFWRLLDQLALAEEPLVAGLEAAPFQHGDPDLAKAYLTSRLTLTSLGKAVLAGGADWTEHHTVDRWWGGTHLTEDNLWRWDGEAAALIPPPR
jgi:hypothetical protein